MLLLETIGFVVLGFAVAYGATRALPDRFPSVLLVRATGPAAALLGGFVTRSVLGPGHPLATLALAAAVSVALVTLLIRPGRGGNGRRNGNGAARTRHA